MVQRCILVDDELPALDELSHLLIEIGGVDILARINNGKKAISKIKELKPDVVFLDIKMPGTDGFEVAREAIALQHPPIIVFATAYNDYAVKAFELKAIDYILKPFSRERLEITVRRFQEAKSKSLNHDELREIIEILKDGAARRDFVRVPVVENGKIILLNPQDIVYCSANEGKTDIHTWDNTFLSTTTLNELEKHLKSENFFRGHRSFLVNLKQVKNIVPWFNGKYLITMQDSLSTEVTVSRNMARLLKKNLLFDF